MYQVGHYLRWSSLILASVTAPNFSIQHKCAKLFHSHSQTRRTVSSPHYPSYPGPPQETPKLSDGAIEDPGSAVSSPSTNSLPGWLNYEIPSRPFWAHYNPQEKPFWKITGYFTTPSRSVPPLFDHSVQVYNSGDKGEHLARHSDPSS